MNTAVLRCGIMYTKERLVLDTSNIWCYNFSAIIFIKKHRLKGGIH
jgi:hypothetical protein